eukprot:10508045-Alexandrium_andersonii.AAC.1
MAVGRFDVCARVSLSRLPLAEIFVEAPPRIAHLRIYVTARVLVSFALACLQEKGCVRPISG